MPSLPLIPHCFGHAGASDVAVTIWSARKVNVAGTTCAKTGKRSRLKSPPRTPKHLDLGSEQPHIFLHQVQAPPHCPSVDWPLFPKDCDTLCRVPQLPLHQTTWGQHFSLPCPQRPLVIVWPARAGPKPGQGEQNYTCLVLPFPSSRGSGSNEMGCTPSHTSFSMPSVREQRLVAQGQSAFSTTACRHCPQLAGLP